MKKKIKHVDAFTDAESIKSVKIGGTTVTVLTGEILLMNTKI